MVSEVPMPTRNINLTPELDRFVAQKVSSGRYSNASEVMRAALRALEREELGYEAGLAELRAAIDKGLASGIAKPGTFERIRKNHKLRPKQPGGILAALRRSPLVGAELDLARPVVRGRKAAL